jgi:hypothetical protein
VHVEELLLQHQGYEIVIVAIISCLQSMGGQHSASRTHRSTRIGCSGLSACFSSPEAPSSPSALVTEFASSEVCYTVAGL